MANNTFDWVGTIKPCKASERFTPYEERTFDSGWTNRTLRFNAVCGSNRHMLEIRGGCWVDAWKNKVMTFGNARGADGRSERLSIPWNKRFSDTEIEKVADFRKYIVDLGDAVLRRKLERLVRAFDDGTVTDEMMDEAGVHDEQTARAQIAALNGKRKTFITEWDFVECVQKMLQDESVQNMRFQIRGNIEMSEYNGRFITRYVPNRILMVPDSTPFKSEGTFDVVYSAAAIDDGDVAESHKYRINTYTFCYDSSRKKRIACPVKLTLDQASDNDDRDSRLRQVLLDNFMVKPTDGVAYKELGVKVDMIDGAEVIPLTEDMLTENELTLLALGVTTMQDIQRDRGNVVYGERVQEYRVKGFARGWMSGAKPTVYTDENMMLPNDEDELDEI